MIIKHSKIQTIFRSALSANSVKTCCLCGAENVSGEVCHLGSGGLTTQRQIIKAFDKGLLKYEGEDDDKKVIAHRLADMPLLMTAPGCRECNIKVLKDIKILPRSVLKSAIDIYTDYQFEDVLKVSPFVRKFVSGVRTHYNGLQCDDPVISFIKKQQKYFRDILEATGNMKKLREVKQ